MNEEFESTNKLPFEVGGVFIDDWERFRIGTCEGLWRSTDNDYEVLAVVNREQGNGHFQDVFDWFTNSCKRDGKNLRFCEVWNTSLKKHLQSKRGFSVEEDTNDMILLLNL